MNNSPKNNNKTTISCFQNISREYEVKSFLSMKGIQFVHNKAILGRYRPDFRIDTHFGCIILEIDPGRVRRRKST